MHGSITTFLHLLDFNPPLAITADLLPALEFHAGGFFIAAYEKTRLVMSFLLKRICSRFKQ